MSYQTLPTDEQVAFTDDLWGVNEFVGACEVTYVSPAEWLRATVGMHMDVKHVQGELRVPLRAAPEENWELCA